MSSCKEGVRLALAEEERLDVAPTYTNIHLLSLFGLLVGGQWLGDDHYQQLGRERWDAFVQYKMSDDVVLLYQTNAAFNMVPRSLFANDEDWQRFRQHVQATVPKEQPKGRLNVRWILYAVIAVIIVVAVILGLANAP